MKKKILIVPDIVGWIIEDMALNIIRVLSDEFEFVLQYADKNAAQMGKEVFSWKNDYSDFDLIFIMSTSYVVNKTDSIKNVVTTIHGGPETEKQNDYLQMLGHRDMGISYVSNQTKKRLTKEIINDREVVIKPNGNDFVRDEKKVIDKFNDRIIEHLKLRKIDEFDVYHSNISFKKLFFRVRYRRKSNGFTNLYFTPHGVNTEFYKQDSISENFVCGYAGWSRYLLSAQRNHRRGFWIMNAQNQLNFDLHIAAGLPEYEKGDIKKLKAAYPSNKIKINSVEHSDMCEFYKGISCYLVPDFAAGGPMPVLEAGAMGIPVVCTNAGLCGDIIEDGVHGKRINTYDEFVNAIAWMRDHPEERKQMGKNLQEYILKNRTWEAVAPYWADFFNCVRRK